MSYKVTFKSDETIADLGDGRLTAITDDTFVLLNDLDPELIRRMLADFVDEVRLAICNLLTMTPGELGLWNPSDKYGESDAFGGPDNCIGFKSVPDGKLQWLRRPALIKAMISLGYLSKYTPSGRIRSNSTKGEGQVAGHARALSLIDQRTLIRETFAHANSIDDVLSLGQSSVLVLEDTLNEIATLPSAPEIIGALISRLELFEGQTAQSKKGAPNGRGDGRQYASPWLLMALAREGVLLWPLPGEDNLVPRLLTPFMWDLFTPAAARELSKKVATAKMAAPIHRRLLLSTNFFSFHDLSVPHLLHLKADYAAREKEGLQFAVTVAYRAIRDHFGLTDEDVGPAADYFGGYVRIGGESADIPFYWVDRPNPKRLERYSKITGNAPPRTFPSSLRNWANSLRQVLPKLGVKRMKQPISDLSFWLIFLDTLGEDAPTGWQEIGREHISGDLGYEGFLRKHGGVRKVGILTTLKHAWLKAAEMEGFHTEIACPIDLQVDLAGERTTSEIRHRTVRVAMHDGLLPILSDINRRDDFAFARALGLYEREVVDSTTGKRVTIFWPAMPIIFDMLFHTAMRGHSVVWTDSGEGDEDLVDPHSLTEFPNNGRAQTKQRKKGFLRIMQVTPGQKVLGMYHAITKTGPRSVPYVDSVLAENVTQMRHLQERYNSRRSPVHATRSRFDVSLAPVAETEKVFPLFRDPGSTKGHPPSEAAVNRYYRELLQVAEIEFNEAMRKEHPNWENVALVVDGRAVFDLHTIRVTIASELADLGVDPNVAKELLGHQSPLMTIYYDAKAGHRTNEQLSSAMEKVLSRQKAEIETAIDAGASLEDISELVGGLFNTRGADSEGKRLLREGSSSREPLVFSHGLCPGADCATGGEAYRGSFLAVFRKHACSNCRYRLTGPAFLNGLVLRANCLIVEIKQKTHQEADLNRKRRALEADAPGRRRLTDGIRKVQEEMRDLWREYVAEVATIQAVSQMMEAIIPTNHKDHDALSRPTPVAVKTHDMVLLADIASTAATLPGAAIEVPEFASSQLAEMSLRILRLNSIEDAFIRLDPDQSAKAVEAFGQLLVSHVRTLAADHHGVFEDLLEGKVTISGEPVLAAEVARFLGGLSKQAALPKRGSKP